MAEFSFIITDNQSTPVFRGEVGDEITDWTFSTIMPGGCEECTFRLNRPITFTPVELYPLGFNFRLDIVDEKGIFWSGRIEKVRAYHNSGGEYYIVIARGYGVNLSDQRAATTNVSGKVTSTIITDAITALTEQIDETDVTASGVTLSAATAINLENMTSAQQIAWAAKFGDSNNAQQVMTVYPDNDGTRRLYFYPRPTEPDISTNVLEFEDTEFGFDGEYAANRVDFIYNGGASSGQVDSTALQGGGADGWGMIKSIPLIINEVTQSADATKAANALLTQASALKLVASHLSCRSNVTFIDSNGQEVPLHRVRSGMLLQFSDVDCAESDTMLSYANSCLIVKTSYSGRERKLTIIPETFANRLEGLQAQAMQILAGRHTV